MFVCASVGDCKAFLIEHDTLKVRDITLDNRGGQQFDADCGGRLGPVMENGGPDLRNLRVYYYFKFNLIVINLDFIRHIVLDVNLVI